MDSANEAVSTTTQSVSMVSDLPDTDLDVRLPQILKSDYRWFNEKNKQEALTHLEGLVTAFQFGLSKQVALYKGKIIDIVAHDMAERTAALIAQQFAFKGLTYLHPKQLSQKTFSVPISKDGSREQKWVYRRIENFGQLVPPQALRTLAYLREAGIVPEGLWVADKKEVIHSYPAATNRLPDPVLCASFGRWIVALAEWD